MSRRRPGIPRESAETGNTAPELAETPEPTPEPIIGDTGKGVIESDGWIYYRADDEEGYSLYLMAEDGSQAEKLMGGLSQPHGRLTEISCITSVPMIRMAAMRKTVASTGSI